MDPKLQPPRVKLDEMATHFDAIWRSDLPKDRVGASPLPLREPVGREAKSLLNRFLNFMRSG